MTATRVRGELGPACAKCGTPKVWSGVKRPEWACRRCNARRNHRSKASKSSDQLQADRDRANALRNARRAKFTPEQREREYERTRAWRKQERDAYLGGARRWYAENSERVRANKQARYEADKATFIARNMVRKKRLREAVCEHGPKCVDSAFLKQVYEQPCHYCGGRTEDADHFIPISGGGLHCRDNIVPACGPCNGSKFNHDPIEWMESRAG